MLNRKLNIRLRHSLNSHCIPSIIINNTVRSFRKRLVRTVLIFTESSDQLSRATDRVPGLPA
ncbi:hypothetical protein FCX76_25430, partial [Escherichia coli]|nr:hypothetical protein [Escherichia coli]MDN0656274.1 hypothetical protein [Escherichia coli]MDN0661181.1 hypothetical protein [Escherichia coli]MDN0671023.1 hypothetical protein [Escherichia coli]MDN0675929.1 hypothetical protein [Escherichia coli]